MFLLRNLSRGKGVSFFEEIETRLSKPGITLESFIVTPTKFSSLEGGLTKEELEERHVLFMMDDKETYVGKLIAGIGEKANCSNYEYKY